MIEECCGVTALLIVRVAVPVVLLFVAGYFFNKRCKDD